MRASTAAKNAKVVLVEWEVHLFAQHLVVASHHGTARRVNIAAGSANLALVE